MVPSGGRLPSVRPVAASRVALNPNQTIRLWQSAAPLLFGIGALALVTLVCFQLGLNLTTAAFAYLIAIVLLSLMGEGGCSEIESELETHQGYQCQRTDAE